MAAELPVTPCCFVFRRSDFMNRKTSVLGGLLLAVVAPLVFGQEPQSPQTPPAPEDFLAASTELIAWTYLQKPKPVPEPLPPPDKGVPEPDQQTAPPPSSQAPDQVPTQTFSGKIDRKSVV